MCLGQMIRSVAYTQNSYAQVMVSAVDLAGAFGGTPAFGCWKNMHARCYNPRAKMFAYYGAKGVTVCERWNSFECFLADMGHPPAGMTIDRIDNAGNYELANCRWATQEQQNENTSRNRYVTWQGKTQTIKAWGKELDLNPKSISERLQRGWTVDRALTTPTARNYAEGRARHMQAAKETWAKRGREYAANSEARRRSNA